MRLWQNVWSGATTREMQMRLKLLIGAMAGLVVSGVLSVSAQQTPSVPPSPFPFDEHVAPPEGLYTRVQARRGLDLYRKNCAYCHREELTGGGPSDSIVVAPPLVGPRFSSYWLDRSLEELVTKISRTMPKYDPGTLSRQEAVDILTYILWESNYPEGETELPAEGDELLSLLYTEYK